MLLFGYSGGQSPPADMLVQGMSQESCLANRPKRGRVSRFHSDIISRVLNMCGGALIGNNVIPTAAHCLEIDGFDCAELSNTLDLLQVGRVPFGCKRTRGHACLQMRRLL